MQNSDDIKKRILSPPDLFHSSTFIIGSVAFLLILLPFSSVNAQLTGVGFQIGAYNYTGDVSPDYEFKNNRPAGSVFFKSNISPSLSLRYGIGGGFISGKDQYSRDPFNIERDQSFTITVLEATALLEFYFLDYKSKHSRTHWTPYLNIGVGLITFMGDRQEQQDERPLSPILPMGVGIKYQLSKKFDLSIEASARPTFTDQLDGVSASNNDFKDYEYGNHYNFDTYYFIGFTLNYTFYFIPCPYGFY